MSLPNPAKKTIFDEEPSLPKDWPCCDNCAKTVGVDCSRTKKSGRVRCREFVRKDGALKA